MNALPAHSDPLRGGLPARVNVGPWLTHYTIDALEARLHGQPLLLPICSLGAPLDSLAHLSGLILPPLYREALEADPHPAELKAAILDQIDRCFPYLRGARRRDACSARLEIVELPRQAWPAPARAEVIAFSVDTAVEQHGPHLPLATDTLQSYAVLRALAGEFAELTVGPAVDYGHLSWGLPRGLSIDLTPPLLTRYVTGFANAVCQWAQPKALYVVDVHGSPVHRQAIQSGLAASLAGRWRFRWLHEPLVEFAFDRQDQHAGAVETCLIEHIHPHLVDRAWWPGRQAELIAGQMSVATALELSEQPERFLEQAESGAWNGVVGRLENYSSLDALELWRRMLNVARQDVAGLLAEITPAKSVAGR